MNPAISIALLLTVLQVCQGQTVTSLTACLVDQSLRLDCRHENTTNLPMQYEFSLTRETKKHVLFGTMGVPEHAYRSRTNFTKKYNIKVLYLSGFTTKDEGIYTCTLHLSGHAPSSQNVSVLRGHGFHFPVTGGAYGGYRKPQVPVQSFCFSESADPLPAVPHTRWGEMGTPPSSGVPVLHAIIHPPPLPPRPLRTPLAVFLYSLFQSCFCLVYLGFYPCFPLGVREKGSQV
ncbi:thy-1 membrane glycoprotein isoform X1 [Carlito syrichta]|uniref:Thy-1 membrane glycoprotein n=1 Tax=Carlito syrichta TaxID=1868482 RepID=A0A3Q0ECP2_CARSF|nr:thy-1 membrane glycoprotein isoform X1 [Carlito syrichta]